MINQTTEKKKKTPNSKILTFADIRNPMKKYKKEFCFELLPDIIMPFICPVNKCYRDFLAFHPPLRQHQFDWLDVMIFKTIQKCQLYQCLHIYIYIYNNINIYLAFTMYRVLYGPPCILYFSWLDDRVVLHHLSIIYITSLSNFNREWAYRLAYF